MSVASLHWMSPLWVDVHISSYITITIKQIIFITMCDKFKFSNYLYCLIFPCFIIKIPLLFLSFSLLHSHYCQLYHRLLTGWFVTQPCCIILHLTSFIFISLHSVLVIVWILLLLSLSILSLIFWLFHCCFTWPVIVIKCQLYNFIFIILNIISFCPPAMFNGRLCLYCCFCHFNRFIIINIIFRPFITV